jgi:hypothetical protein
VIVYQTSGNVVTLDNISGTANVLATDAINPITGSIGLGVAKITNASNDITTIAWTPFTVTYNYVDVASTTNQVGSGATFNVVMGRGDYQSVTIVTGGIDYVVDDIVTIDGSLVGGTSPGNDIILIVTEIITATGAIVNFTYTGTTNWPQSYTSTVDILPLNTEFVQVTSGTNPTGVYFVGLGLSGNTLIQPVTAISS